MAGQRLELIGQDEGDESIAAVEHVFGRPPVLLYRIGIAEILIGEEHAAALHQMDFGEVEHGQHTLAVVVGINGAGIIILPIAGHLVGHEAAHGAQRLDVGTVDVARHLEVGEGVHLRTQLLGQRSGGLHVDGHLVVLCSGEQRHQHTAYRK